MNKQEFLAQYGSVKVKFSSYYKYVFYYAADLDGGSRLCCEVGGNSDDIYRHEVSAEHEEIVSGLDIIAGNVTKEGVTLVNFYGY